jgi:DNA helicase HerA-like ATPase
VIEADEPMLKDFVGFVENGLHIGKLQNHEVAAKLDLTRLLHKHVAFLAMSGAGKSHCVSVLFEELLERPKEQGRIAVVVVDIHGEYVGFKFDPNYGRKVKIVSGKEMCIPFRQLSPGLISTWFTEISSVGRNELAKIMREMSLQEKNERQVFGVPDLIQKVESAKMPKSTQDSLLRALYELKALNLISQSKEIPNLRQNVQPGEMLVLDLSDMDDMRKKKLIVSYVASRLFNLRRKEQIPPQLRT